MEDLQYFLDLMVPLGWGKYIPRLHPTADKVMPGIIAISVSQPFYLHTNCYLLEGDNPTIVDPGHAFPTSVLSLLAGLNVAGFSPSDINLVAATHPHVDHAGAMVIMEDTFHCSKGMYEGAFPSARDYRIFLKSAREKYEERKRHMAIFNVSQAEIDTLPKIYYIPEGKITLDTPFRNGGVIRMGSRDWRIIHTPGHCPYHTAFLDEKEGVLLSGDLFIGKATSMGEIEAYLETLKLLDGIGAKIVLPGHGRPMLDLKEQVQVARKTITERLDSAIAKLREKPLSVGELGLELYGQIHEINLASTAISMCRAVIEYLLARGTIRETEKINDVAAPKYKAY